MNADVIVVGAGPSGSAAAATLASSGARVLLVERSSFPREKACGDGLSPRAVSSLSQLGVDVGQRAAVVGVRIRAPGDSSNSVPIGLGYGNAAVVPRSVLDEALASAASRAGADLWTKTTAERLIIESGTVRGVDVRSSTGRRERLRAPVTILAEGSVGRLACQASLPRAGYSQSFFGVRRYFDQVQWMGPPELEFFLPLEFSGAVLPGYAWVFPVEAGLANVGVGYFSDENAPHLLRHLLRGFEHSLSATDPRFTTARPTSRALGAPIRVGWSRDSCHAPGLLLVGDCAGLANPLSAEGISKALDSGILGGRSALAYLRDGTRLAGYGQSLSNWNPSFERTGFSLPAVYRFASRVSRELTGFFGAKSLMARAVLGTAEIELTGVGAQRGPIPARRPHPLAEDARLAAARARRIAARDRPIFREIIEQIDWLGRHVASPSMTLLTAGGACAGFDRTSRDVRYALVSFELLRIAALLVDQPHSSFRSGEDPEARGGTWLSATLSLALADRLLARIFALGAQLSAAARGIVSEGVLEVFERLVASCETIGTAPQSQLPQLLSAAAARVGARLGAVEFEHADRVARAAAAAAGRIDASAERCIDEEGLSGTRRDDHSARGEA